MADKASQSYTIERLKGDADAITDRLLAGVSDGSNFPQHLIPLILQIPDLQRNIKYNDSRSSGNVHNSPKKIPTFHVYLI